MPPKEDNTRIASDMGRTLLNADTDGNGLDKHEIAAWADTNRDGKVSKEEMAELMKKYGMSIKIHQMFWTMENMMEKPWFSCLGGPVVRAINNRAISSLIKVPGTEGRDCTHEEFCQFELGNYGTKGKDGKMSIEGTLYAKEHPYNVPGYVEKFPKVGKPAPDGEIHYAAANGALGGKGTLHEAMRALCGTEKLLKGVGKCGLLFVNMTCPIVRVGAMQEYARMCAAVPAVFHLRVDAGPLH